jgi:hypothetical protein
MLQAAQFIGAGTALLSAVFWGLGAGIRIPAISWWWWHIGDQDPTTTALRRQSLMNAVAAVFAAVSAVCQAILIYAAPSQPL